jgi:hypothetical protein
MIRSQLCAALDFGKKKNVPHEAYAYRLGEQWYIVRCGPGYSNSYKVIEFDDAGLAQLLAKERKEESTVTA